MVANQKKYNNKHRMKSNSGMIFVMIGDRRSGGQSTKQHNNKLNHIQPVWPHLLDGFGTAIAYNQTLWEGCH